MRDPAQGERPVPGRPSGSGTPGPRPSSTGEPGPPEVPVTRRRMLRITALAGISAGLVGALTLDLLRALRMHRIRSTRAQLGTWVTLTVVHPDPEAARRLVSRGFAEIERLEGILSRHRPDTPLSRLNRDGVLRRPPGELVQVLGHGLEVAARSGGAFDPSAAPLVDLYRRSFQATGSPPPESEVALALARVGFARVRLEEGRISLGESGMSLTLDGIAKGFVVDRVVALLRDGGMEHVLVDAGGDLVAAGEGPEGLPWEIGIRHPRDPRGRLALLRTQGGGVATSGDYVHSYTEDHRFHAIVDPRTGNPSTSAASVTVRAPTAMEADALATTAMVLAPPDALRLLGEAGADGIVVTKEGGEFRTPGFDGGRWSV